MIQAYLLLAVSIGCEVLGTSLLPATKGFTVLKPTILVICIYIICFAAFVKDLQMIFGFTTPQAIYKWQSGASMPTIDNLIVLSAILNVKVEDIVVVKSV